MKYLKQFLKDNKKHVFLNLVFLFLQSIGTLIIPFLIAGMVDKGILKGDMNTVITIGGWMLIAALLTTVVSILGSWYSADLAALFGQKMREKLFSKSQELSMSDFDNVGLSSMVTRSTSDILTMQTTFGMVLQLIVPAPLLALSSIVMTFYTSPSLAPILILSILIFIIFAIIILKVSSKLSSQIQYRLDRINLVVREAVTGTRVIRAFGNETYEEKRSGEIFESYAANMIKLNRMFAVMNPIVWLVMGFGMAAILWFGGVLVANQSLEIGKITAVSEYAIMTLGYLIMAAATSASLPKMRSCLSRLTQVLDTTSTIQDGDITHTTINDEPVFSFNDVTFSYNGAEEDILHGLSFTGQKGQTIAIIGGTGSGKSTVAELLLRLHDVNGGSICIHGQDIRSLSQYALRQNIGYVPQKAFLFSGTIRENLLMGNKDADEATLWEALRVAQSDGFVLALPLGLDAPVSQGGTNFSGGQRQRLAIARALVKQASIYVFDDSFSALDVKTDGALRQALKDYGKDAVKLIIAQRVSTIIHADQILVLDDGKLVGTGHHNELIKNCQTYQEIVNSQMQREEDQ